MQSDSGRRKRDESMRDVSWIMVSAPWTEALA